MTLDFSTDHGKRALNELETAKAIWFTTVTPAGVPQPNPVWFVWNADDESVYTFVQPQSARIRNLKANPNVSLHFASDPNASTVTVLTGVAEFVEEPPTLHDLPIYASKYGEAEWAEAGMTPEGAAKEYSVLLRIRINKVRGF